MRIAFVDLVGWDYSVETPYARPLGGSQSALCYLAEALAQRGHEVSAITHTTTPGRRRHVECLPFAEPGVAELRRKGIDFCIILNTAGAAAWCRANLGQHPKIILWTQHAADQPAVRDLTSAAVVKAHDAFVFVSQWQQNQYVRQFGLLPQRTTVLRNAVAPFFEGRFAVGSGIRTVKDWPPVLAYTSTPFRGLDVLVEVFPRIRRDAPGVTLKVFSSMQVYLVEASQDAYGALYRACRDTEGIEYIGSVPQPELARHMMGVAVLAYPNVFAETSCIAVMEAMAAGCWVITSRLGALGETTAGFGQLISMTKTRPMYVDQFHRTVIQFLEQYADPKRSNEIEETLRRQVAFVGDQYTWARRAAEWERWLAQL